MGELRNILKLALSISWPHVRREWIRYTLTLFGVSLGIIVYGGVRLSTRAAVDKFVESSRFFSSVLAVTVYSDTGRLPNTAVRALVKLAFVQAVVPISAVTTVTIPEARRVTLVGTDLLSIGQLGAAAPSESVIAALRDGQGFAGVAVPVQENAVQLAINGKVVTIPVAGRLREGMPGIGGDASAFIVDIGTFSSITGRGADVDRMEVLVSGGLLPEAACDSIAKVIGTTNRCSLQGPVAQMSSVASSFEISLAFLSGLALFVGALLISSTLHYVLMLRRYESGILRSIGASRKTLLGIVIIELSVLAGLASVIGASGAVAFARAIAPRIAGSISTLYFSASAPHVTFSWQVALECLGLGFFTTFAAAALPAREFVTSPPSALFSSQVVERRIVRLLPFAVIGGAVLGIAAVMAVSPRFLDLSRALGLVPPSLTLAGASCLMLPALWGTLRFFRQIPWSFPAVRLAVDHLSTTPWRTTLAAAAILAASGLYIGVSTMVASFREAVDVWITHLTRAEVFIAADPGVSSVGVHFVPDKLIEALETSRCVSALARSADRTIVVSGHPMRATSMRMSEALGKKRLSFLSPPSPTSEKALLAGEPVALLSESAATRLVTTRGQTIPLPSARGIEPVRVVGILRDYTTDQGVIFLPEPVFAKFFGQPRFATVGVYLTPGCTVEDVREEVTQVLPDFTGSFHTAVSLRGQVLRIFDDTFQITYVLQAVCLFIAAATVVNSLSMLLHEKERHIGILRAIGASRSTITQTIATEALIIGLLGGVGGIATGLAISWQLAGPINQIFFGWTVPLTIFPTRLLTLLCTIGAVSGVMGYVVGTRFVSQFKASSLRYE